MIHVAREERHGGGPVYNAERMIPIQLRPYREEDVEFLFQLYASTRQQEIATLGWPEAQQGAFLRMQFTAQQRWYASAYPEAEHQIIERDGVAMGRFLVMRQPASVMLVDIALLPDHRGQGIGTELVGQLVRQCQSKKVPLRLQVLKGNPR